MTENELKWTVESSERLLSTPVFDVIAQHEATASGLRGDYIALDAPDWVMVIPEKDGEFLLVRQWRHASQELSLEFPGGVVDEGEEPSRAAARELLEETGYCAGSLIHLGSCRPNPALFNNRTHLFLARGLTRESEQHLDDDELLTFESVAKERVLSGFGTGEMTHALMGTAIGLYRAYIEREQDQM